jgi:hypothetical protein
MRGPRAKLAGTVAAVALLVGAMAPGAGAVAYQPADVLIPSSYSSFGGIDIDQSTRDVYVGGGVGNGGIFKFTPEGIQTKFGATTGYNGLAVNSTTHMVYGVGSGNSITGFDSVAGEGIVGPFAAGGPVFGDLATNAAGDVFAGLFGNSGIKQFTAGGVLRRTITCAGCPAPASFSTPSAIDFDASGDMYVADFGNGRVLKFTSSGGDPADYSTVPPIVFAEGAASSVAVDPNTGNVFVGGDDGAGYHVKGYDASGTKFADFGTGLLANSLSRDQLAVDHTTGLVYVSDANPGLALARVWVFGPIEAPIAAPSPATGIAQTTATLTGSVDPGGDVVEDCRFEYGPTASYDKSAQCAKYPGFGVDPVPVSAEISGLDPDTTYHYRVVATNGVGTDESADEEFTTLIAKPGVSTGAASGASSSGATISGSVDPLGNPVDACRFEYGITSAYGSQAPCPTDPGSGPGVVGESLALSGLTPNTTYHYRLVAENEGGMSAGADVSFRTLPSAPGASTGSASGITPVAANLGGSVEPRGATTSYRFEYGTTLAYGQSTAATETSGDGNKEVGASLGGLKPATTYHYRLVASNAGGSAGGADKTFTTQERPKGKLALPPTGALKGAKVSVALECRGGSLAICEGSLVLRARVKQGIRLILVKVGEADYSIDGGKTEAVSVKLNGNGQKVVSQANGKTIGAIAAADGHNRQLRLSASTNRNANKKR